MHLLRASHDAAGRVLEGGEAEARRSVPCLQGLLLSLELARKRLGREGGAHTQVDGRVQRPFALPHDGG